MSASKVSLEEPASAGRKPPRLYFPTLDGLRFFAFLLVFIHHLPKSSEPILALIQGQGWVGVQLFLFLSAYLLTAILRSEFESRGAISISSFYMRRGLRIWPLYFLFCFFAIALVWAKSSISSTEWIRFFGLMTFTDNFMSGLWGYNNIPFTAHLWTISVEEQFYLLLPFLLGGILTSRDRLYRTIFLFWLSFVAVRIVAVLFKAPHPMIWTSVVSADALLLGTLFGVVQPRPTRTTGGRLILISVGVVSLFFGALLPPIDKVGFHQVFVYTFVGIGAAALTTAALHDPALNFLQSGPLRYLGKISYGLYVFHFLGIGIGTKLLAWAGYSSWWITAIVAILITILLAVFSYEFFERHFLKLKYRFEAVHSRPI